MTAPLTALSTASYSAQPPQFPQGVLRRQCSVTAANNAFTSTTASTGDVTLVAGADNVAGALVKRLYAIPLATNTATALQLFRTGKQLNTGSAVKQFEDAVTAAASTVSTTASPSPVQFTQYTPSSPLRLSPGDGLSVGISVALSAGWVFVAEIEFYAVAP